MNLTDESKLALALSLIPDLGPVRFKRLMEVFGTPEKVLAAAPAELASVQGMTPAIVSALRERSFLRVAESELRKASVLGVDILTILDSRYPEDLRQIFDAPIVLYVMGALPAAQTLKIAVVGARDGSSYGLSTAKRIAADLAACGVVVVSGMARGIDSAAHEGVLSADGATIAVLGGGLSAALTTRENKKMAEKISQKGAVISEYPVDMVPLPKYFPIRNRIISGLSRATLVVEAKEKSGALITADAALEQGRDVFAVPGNVDAATSAGTNRLLKQGAKVVTCAEDILNEFFIETRPSDRAERQSRLTNAPSLSDEENQMLSLLAFEPAHVDALVEKSQLPTGRAIAMLSFLEIKGYAKQLPGKNYVLGR